MGGATRTLVCHELWMRLAALTARLRGENESLRDGEAATYLRE